MKIILGTGQLGLAVAEALLRRNPSEEITLINRTGRLNTPLPVHIQIISADVTDQHKLECIARDAETIFSCTDVPYQQWADFYPAVASALAYTLSKTNVKLIFADNFYSYGNVAGAVMHEGLAHAASTKKGKIRAKVLNRLLFSRESFNDRVAVVKASDFIGPKIYKGLFGRDFLDRLYQGKPIFLFGKIKQPHAFTYIDDFAEAMVIIGNAQDAFGQVWHVPNAPAINLINWVELFEKETGIKVAVKVLPKFVVSLAGIFNSFARELRELAYQYEHPYLVDHSKFEKRFGNCSTSHAVAVKKTVEWYQGTQCTKKGR